MIRTDASAKMGAGHVMRCLTLAKALQKKKFRVEFICHVYEDDLISFIKKDNGFSVHVIPNTHEENTEQINWVNDAKYVVSIIKRIGKPVDMMVVDHYMLDQLWEQKIEPYVKKILVIDDLANRQHACDLLVDQNFYLKKNRYDGLVPDKCIQMTGVEYIMLREQFEKLQGCIKTKTGNIQRILICYGGSDFSNETGKALSAIQKLDRKDVHVDVVIGKQNQNKEKIRQKILQIVHGKCHIQVDNMAQLISKADLCIGAVGSMTWERCVLGVPSIVSAMAENQIEVAESLSQKGIIHYIGDAEKSTSDDYLDAIHTLSSNKSYYFDLSNKSKKLVDAKGTLRIVEQVQKQLRKA
ncbi:MAG: UDP-2,4-diacetamido-2,4,6-trideoxy-beta-L-altropyranose hydrolase [Pseudomonadota bacterium]